LRGGVTEASSPIPPSTFEIDPSEGRKSGRQNVFVRLMSPTQSCGVSVDKASAIRQAICRKRKKMGITQAEVSQASGIHVISMAQWESGQTLTAEKDRRSCDATMNVSQ
jgi:hypothetical protein